MTALTTVPFFTWPSGEASFTLAVTTSPKPARSPVEPPSGRITCSLRAPELSATSSQVLIITAIILSPRGSASLNFRSGVLGYERRLANNLLEPPALQLRQRPSLFQPHHIANASFVLFIVGVELFRLRNHAAIKRMRFFADDLDYDGLLHAV